MSTGTSLVDVARKLAREDWLFMTDCRIIRLAPDDASNYWTNNRYESLPLLLEWQADRNAGQCSLRQLPGGDLGIYQPVSFYQLTQSQDCKDEVARRARILGYTWDLGVAKALRAAQQARLLSYNHLNWDTMTWSSETTQIAPPTHADSFLGGAVNSTGQEQCDYLSELVQNCMNRAANLNKEVPLLSALYEAMQKCPTICQEFC